MPDILITGGSDGIGLAVAKLLAAPGDARVTLVARSESKLRDAVAQLPGAGHDFIVADLSAQEGVDLVVDRLATRHYDILINNAGAGLYGRFAELPLDDQLRMMRLNMESVSVLSHAYLCRAKPGDALVNTASFVAYAPLPGNAAYSATKAFVATLSETLWWENKRNGIYVLCFCPGVITTGFHDTAGKSVANLSPRSPAVAGERRTGAGGDAAEASLAARHHRLRHAPIGPGTAARQPEDGDQHDGKERPAVVIGPTMMPCWLLIER